MRALRFDGSPRLIPDHPQPRPGPGEALVAVRRAGIAPIDAAIARGSTSIRFEGTLGHEFVGVVREVNLPRDAQPHLANRRALVDKRVVCTPSIACTQCDLCRSGLSSHCRSRRVLGARGADGCFAEFVVAPLMNLWEVPARVDDDRAVFASALARAAHVAHLVRSSEQQMVTVLGDSLCGLLAAQALSRLNKTVRMLGDLTDRGALCDKWGVKHRPVAEAGRRQDQDVVIDCTGSAAGLRLAMQFVRPRGVIVLKPPMAGPPFPAGVPFAERPEPDSGWNEPIDLTPLAAAEITLIGTREGSLPDALDLLAREEVDVRPLISRRFRLDDGVRALEAAGQPETLKVLIDIAER